jgi:hypothetical protein
VVYEYTTGTGFSWQKPIFFAYSILAPIFRYKKEIAAM